MGIFSKLFKSTRKAQPDTTAPATPTYEKKIAQQFFTFIDLETPNRRNDRICSIAVVKTDSNGNVIKSFNSLVDPEVLFDEVNISIHGINSYDIVGKETFKNIWESEIRGLIIGSTVVAHNAIFDLTVLNKTLNSYGITCPNINYLCSMELAKEHVNNCYSGKLDELCKALGVTLNNHHDAKDDADACMGLFWEVIKIRGSIPSSNLFTPSFYKPIESIPSRSRNSKTSSLQSLKLNMEEAVADNVITIEEAIQIQDAITSNDELLQDATLGRFSNLLQQYLEDGFISPEESQSLLKEFAFYLDPLSQDQGYVDFDGMNFMLTGDFDYGSKEEVADYIQNKGGVMLKSVRKDCNYLVVGNKGSGLWSFGNYGSKVKKAMDWKTKGQPIKIVSEKSLFQ